MNEIIAIVAALPMNQSGADACSLHSHPTLGTVLKITGDYFCPEEPNGAGDVYVWRSGDSYAYIDTELCDTWNCLLDNDFDQLADHEPITASIDDIRRIFLPDS